MLLGLSFAYIPPGCVPAEIIMLVLRSILLLLVAIAATLLIPAIPCVPLYSTVINLKKPRISRAFGTIVRIYTAWLRSGDFNGTVSAFTLYGSGGHINYVTDRNFAVRPRFTCLRKIYCRQFPNSARSSTTEQIML